MSERDELMRLIWSVETQDFGGYSQRDAEAVADKLMDAGYRKVQVGEREKILALIDYAENLRGSSMYCKVTTYELRKALGLSN